MLRIHVLMVVFALMDQIGIVVNASLVSLESTAVSTSTNVAAHHVLALVRNVLMVLESIHVYARKDGKENDVKVKIRFS